MTPKNQELPPVVAAGPVPAGATRPGKLPSEVIIAPMRPVLPPAPTSNETLPITEPERKRINALAGEANALLLQQPDHCMPLCEFTATLRDFNLRSAMIDELVVHLATSGIVQLWKLQASNEMWIGLVPA